MKKILIVDDESPIRKLVLNSLKDEGYDLCEAENGKQALEKAREVKPDLVVLDVMMPDRWGYDVCEDIKKDPDTGNPKVLFLTGRSSLPSRKIARDKGGDDYIVKPFRPAELRDKVKSLLGAD